MVCVRLSDLLAAQRAREGQQEGEASDGLLGMVLQPIIRIIGGRGGGEDRSVVLSVFSPTLVDDDVTRPTHPL